MNNTVLIVLTVLTPVLMAVIVAIQTISVALIQRGRKEDKKERAIVAVKVEETAVVAAETKEIAQSSHDIANSRYDELKDELVKSNARVVEQNKQIMKLLQLRNGQARASDAESQQSGIIAAEGVTDTGSQEGA